MADDVKALGLGDLLGKELTVGLESRHNIDIGVVLGSSAAGLDGSTVHHQTGAVDTAHSHQHTGHVLVTAGNTDVGIVPLSTHHGLDGIGNKVTTL